MNNPFTSAKPWQGGSAYERYMGRWSRRLAPMFLAGLDRPRGQRWLDVGCGTGALCSAILEGQAPSALTGVDPSEGFLATARERLGDRVQWHCAPAQELPLPGASVDTTAAALVLNFVPDAQAALREMVRVTAEGGCVAACVWDYGGRMDLIRHYWTAAADVVPETRGRGQGESFPLCQPDALQSAFTDAGLRQVAVRALELPMPFADFDDCWGPFLGGQGTAPAHAMSLDETTRGRLRDRLHQLVRELADVQPDGSFTLGARAWSVHGAVAR